MKYILMLFLMLGQLVYTQAQTTDTIPPRNGSVNDILEKIKGSDSTNSSSSESENDAKTDSSEKGTYESKKMSKDDQELFTRLVYDGLYLVRQEYKVNGAEGPMGKDEMPYYGYQLGVGVQVGENILLPIHLYNPWEYDDEYAKVKLKFPEALSSPAKIMNVSETEYSTVEQDVTLSEGANLAYIENKGSGFELNPSEEVDGNLLLVLISVSDKSSESPIIFQETRMVSGNWGGSVLTLENYKVPKNCVGGILFSKEESPGQLTMKVAGIGSMVQSDMVIYNTGSYKEGNGKSSKEKSKDEEEDEEDDKKDKKKKKRRRGRG